MTGFEVALVAASVASVGATVYSGMAQAEAADFQKAQLEDQAAINEIQALQEENQRQDRLRRVLKTQQAQAASQGIDISDSRSFMAIQDAERTQARKDVANIRLMGSSARRQNRLAVGQAELQGRSAMIGAGFNSVATLGNAGMSAYSNNAFGMGTGK